MKLDAWRRHADAILSGLMKAWYTADSTVSKFPAALNISSESSLVWRESSRSDSILAERAWDR